MQIFSSNKIIVLDIFYNYTLLCFFPTTNFILQEIGCCWFKNNFWTKFLHFQKSFGHFYLKGLWNVIKLVPSIDTLSDTYRKQHQTHKLNVANFDPFYIQPNINMAIQQVLNKMQEYKYIQYTIPQVMNINCKKLSVYSYCYPVFLYAYIYIACKILNFSATAELIHFEL